MELRKLYKEFVLLVLLVILHNVSCSDYEDEEDPSFWSRCSQSIRNKLKNGRVKIRSRGRIAKFICDTGFELVGKRFATCVRNQWNNPLPVCVARGCYKMQEPSNGRITEMYRGALLMFDCLPGYAIEGANTVYCDGRRWSAQTPTCKVATSNPKLYCDFEDPDLCGWSHDPTNDFDWKRNQFGTPSGHVGTGPSYDHTYGKGKGGFYLYEEASSPRKENDKSRIFSPVFPFHYSGGCFIFYYHMYGATTGGLLVYVKPESHVFDELEPSWQKSGDQGNQWLRGNITVPVLSENFQIIIEGVRGSSYVGDTAIDDVSINPTECEAIDDYNFTNPVEKPMSDSCRGRCREEEYPGYCGCNDNCYFNENCCSDYGKICTAGNVTADLDHPDEFSTPYELYPITTTYVAAKTSTKLLPTTSSRTNSVTESEEKSSTAASQRPITSTNENTELTLSQSKSSIDETSSTSHSPQSFHHITLILPVTSEEKTSKTTTKQSTDKPTNTRSTIKLNSPESTTKLANTKPTTATTEKKSTSKIPVVTSGNTTTTTTEKTMLSSKSSSSGESNDLSSTLTKLTASSTTKQPTTKSTIKQLETSTRQLSLAASTLTSPSTAKKTLPSTTKQTTTKTPNTVISTMQLFTSTSKRSTTSTTVTLSPFPSPTTSSRFTTNQYVPSTTKQPLTSTTRSYVSSTRKQPRASTIRQSVPSTTKQPLTATTKQSTGSTSRSIIASTTKPESITTSVIPTSSTKLTTQPSATTSTSSQSDSSIFILHGTRDPYSSFSTVPTTTRRYNLRPRTRTYTLNVKSTRRDEFPNTVYTSSVSPQYRSPLTFHTTRPVRPTASTRSRTTDLQTKSTHTNPSATKTLPFILSSSYQTNSSIWTSFTTPEDDSYKVAKEHHPEHQGHSSKSPSDVERSSSIVGVSVTVVLLSIMAAVVAYVMHKRRSRQHSKMTDDSEMRFLSDNEVIEYSDASALDRILVK